MKTITQKRETIYYDKKMVKHMPGLVHVIKAINFKSSNEVLKFISVQDKYVIGTDGGRLHFTEKDWLPSDLRDGLYRVHIVGGAITLIPEEGYSYPDVKPFIEFPTTKPNLNIRIDPKDDINMSSCIVKLSALYEYKQGIRYSFIEALPGLWSIWYNKDNHNKSLFMKDGVNYAVILPFMF